MPHLIVLSHLRWGFVFQRPQHLMTRLADHYEVLFIEEPVFDAGPAHFVSSHPAPNVEVLVPHTPVQAGGFHDDQLDVLHTLIGQELERRGIRKSVLWLYTPMATPLIAAVKPQLLVYDCMDELSAFKHAPAQLHERETSLLERADIVLTGGPGLYDAKRRVNPKAVCLPSAVDAEHYAPAKLVAGSEHAQLAAQLHAGMPRPRLGFFGVIDERFDIELLAALAEHRPDWQFVMAGPVVKIDPATLPRASNIHWLGMQSYARLPYLMAQWDLCLMPFAMNESTRFISPTKTLEYMAGGKPVVSTPVADVVRLYNHVVRIAGDAEAFVEACEAAMAEQGVALLKRTADMEETVAANSWDRCASRVHDLIVAAGTTAEAPSPSPFNLLSISPLAA